VASVRLKARQKYRKLQKRIPEPDSVSHLNITPMMDMMTILVVFFLKSFSVSSENINLDPDEIMLPRSSSELKPHQAVKLTITRRAILVEDDPVAAVKKGEVDSSIKRDGQSSYLITPLLNLLQKHATRLKELERRKMGKFEGEVVVIADQNTPYRLLSEVLYTAGQAEFGKYRLMVLQGG
jgi:biopolymer transport protein ExbD